VEAGAAVEEVMVEVNRVNPKNDRPAGPGFLIQLVNKEAKSLTAACSLQLKTSLGIWRLHGRKLDARP